LAYIEGVVDVSILVPCCFDNPLKELAANFVADVLARKKPAVVPATSVIGAYHIATRYLRTPRLAVKKILEGMLRTRSPALFSEISPELVEDALNYSAVYGIESWDGYLVAVARILGVKEIYSIDEELSKVREVYVRSPFPKDKLEEYHRHLGARRRNISARD
jgi:predicted nucleic acid-binding protein